MTRPSVAAEIPFLVLGLAGLFAGFAALRLAEMPDRWVAAAVAGMLVLLGVLLAGRPRRAALFVFAFSLQTGLALYLTEPPPASSVGASWPNALALPLASLTGLVALVTARARPWRWGGSLGLCAGLLLLTTAFSLWSSPVRLIGVSHLALLASYYGIFLAAANAIRDDKDLQLVQRVLLLSLGAQSVIYLAQVAAGGTFTLTGEWIEQAGEVLPRYGGTVGTRPAAFSSFLVPLLLLAFSQSLSARTWWPSGLLAAAGCAALALSYTRAAWIGFALGLLYLLAARARRGMLGRGKFCLLLGIPLAVSLALSPRLLTRAGQDHWAALEERWTLVQMALRVIQENPLTGVGAGAYPYVFRDYLNPELSDRWLFVVHNVYVLRAAETGLLGLAALLLFLGVAFRKACPERMANPAASAMALGWRAGQVALAWEMLWDVSLGPAANALFWFLCGALPAARKGAR